MSWRTLFMDADERAEYRQLQIFFFAAAFLVTSAYLSFVELRYLAFSQLTMAQVRERELREIRSRHGNQKELRLKLDYQNAAGELKHLSVSVSPEFEVAVGDQVRVQYFSGEDPNARLAESAQMWPLLVLAAAVGFVAFTLWSFAKEANEPFKKDRNARRHGVAPVGGRGR